MARPVALAAINVVTALTLDEFREEAFLVGYIQGTRHPLRPAPVRVAQRPLRALRVLAQARAVHLLGRTEQASFPLGAPATANVCIVGSRCLLARVGADFRAVCAGAQAAGTSEGT